MCSGFIIPAVVSSKALHPTEERTLRPGWSGLLWRFHLRCERLRFDLGLGRAPGEGNGYPLQYSCLKNPMDRGAWGATVHGVAKRRTRLSDLTHSGWQWRVLLLNVALNVTLWVNKRMCVWQVGYKWQGGRPVWDGFPYLLLS